MTRGLIYARVSSEEQASPDKSSIQVQLNDCRALAAKLGWVVVGEFVDDRKYRVGSKLIEPSGTRADRPQWRKLLEALSSGRAEAVVAWHSSRLYRGYTPMAAFLEVVEAHHVQVALAKENWNTDFAIFGAWQARQENLARVARTNFGRIARSRKGLTATSHSVYFRKVVEPGTGEVLGVEFDEQYRALFDRLALLFLQKLSYREIAKQLGPHPKLGKPWVGDSVRTIVTNPFYRGIIEYGRGSRNGAEHFRVPARHRPVWDAETCAAIEIECARRAAAGFHVPHSRLAPFAGILRCGYCGKLMAASYPRGKTAPDGRPYRFYGCHTNLMVAKGYLPGVAHPPNNIAEPKLMRSLRAVLAQLSTADVDEIMGRLAELAPAPARDDGETRAQLADVLGQIAELEPEIARVRSAAARAAIEGELIRLRGQAELYQSHLADAPGSTVNLPAMRAELLHLIDSPDLLSAPDPELKLRLGQAFPALYVIGAEFVGSPVIQ